MLILEKISVFKSENLGELPGLMVQWLRLHAPNAQSRGMIPGQETETLQAAQLGQKKKEFYIG